MRKQIAAGNWKMNLDAEQAQGLVSEVMGIFQDEINNQAEVIFGAPAIFLATVQHLAKDHPQFHVAAQNIHQEAKGAFTGDISANMVASVGVTHVIIGHSERRQYYGEDNALLEKKLRIALDHGLTPIYCLGEVLSDRESGNTFDVVSQQLSEATFGLNAEDFGKLVIAYEPVWAIGTGKTASPEQAQEVHAYLRGMIRQQFGEGIADNTSILYGGSVKPGNAVELFGCPDIDGGLVGGASMKSADFTAIIKALN